MTLAIAPSYRRPALLITPLSQESIATELRAHNRGGQPTSATYPTTNRALYFPFTLTETYIVDKAFVVNGTAVSGNFDVGVYSSAATPARLFSTGSTAQSGTNVVQEVNVTNYALPAGQYYLAIACDNTTATFFGVSPADSVAMVVSGCAMQATAFALPSTATLAATTGTRVPLFGISARSLVA